MPKSDILFAATYSNLYYKRKGHYPVFTWVSTGASAELDEFSAHLDRTSAINTLILSIMLRQAKVCKVVSSFSFSE
jgi:hypothetical protein